VIVPEMVGAMVGVYNGKVFNTVEVKFDMIGRFGYHPKPVDTSENSLSHISPPVTESPVSAQPRDPSTQIETIVKFSTINISIIFQRLFAC
jgi:hypothetical protein